MLVLLAAVYVCALGVLLWVTRRKRRYYTHAKLLCSVLFIVTAVVSFFSGGQNRAGQFALLAAALVMCAAGDVLLGMANRTKTLAMKPFRGGTLCFLLAHVLFCAMLYARRPFHWYDLLLPLCQLALIWYWNKCGVLRLRSMAGMAYLYSLLVSLMVVKALQAGFFARADKSALLPAALMAAGAVLFWVSDLILVFMYFGKIRHKRLRYWNLSTYYMGVFLLALSPAWW